MTDETRPESTRTGTETADRISTGVAGIDEILDGGLMPTRSTLVRGPPGAGKTLFGLHYLTAGADDGETGLFINMGEPEKYIRENARAFGFDLDAFEFLDLRPEKTAFTEEASYDVFPPQEVEGPSFADEITMAFDEVEPERVFIDPLTQLRYLSNDPYHFRNQVMGLFRLMEDTGTVFTSQATDSAPDDDLQFVSDAVINLSQGGEYRTVGVSKFRGSDFRRGKHTVRITDDGMVVAPRLTPAADNPVGPEGALQSGVPELDALLQGGIDHGTVTMFTGPTGVGKTTTGLQFITEAAGRGRSSMLYSFEENRGTLLQRADAVDIPVRDLLDQDTLTLETIEPGAETLDEFAQRVRRDVESDGTEIVMLDAIDGYRQNLRGADPLDALITLGRYLRNAGATAIFVNEVHQVTGDFRATGENISQLTDNIVFLRHIEYRGELRKVIGVLKQRTSDFEHRLRELQITEHGLEVGEPLPELQGILTGTPDWDQADRESAFMDTDATDT